MSDAAIQQFDPDGLLIGDDDGDDWDDPDDDWHEPEPEEFADPACIVCGGQGGWIIRKRGRDEWRYCDCIDWGEFNAALNER